jgi:hypothetical protein
VCQRSQRSLTISNEPLHLTSTDIIQTYCARQQGNLVLHALPGQQINVTLLDFSWGRTSSDCLAFGTVTDYQTGRVADICGGRSRHAELMLSISSTVLISPPDPGLDDKMFLLRVQGGDPPDLSSLYILPNFSSWM